MGTLDSSAIRSRLTDQAQTRLAQLDVFGEIDSTNSYLLQRPGPRPQQLCVAATTNQTQGRGQRGRQWISPAGSGVCLSVAYTYERQPENLPALTLVIGIAATAALRELGIDEVQLKWPNDLVANNSKLGGILVEAQQQADGTVMVVAGIGINIDLPAMPQISAGSEWADGITDLTSIGTARPARDEIAAAIINHLHASFVEFGDSGFEVFLTQWRAVDWLWQQSIRVKVADETIAGIAVGVAADGALLVDVGSAGIRRVTSGSVVSARRVG